eukprot:GFUD01033118.1.p1 GENE.GFUD01033118.1~~GFUD01033118.1.p1  ORF type:complete len:651 (+),score=133.69 GFUD01033118.1:226-2178(+)
MSKMRISGYTDKTGQKQHLFTALLQECQLANPGYQLSNNLCKKIEEFNKDDRKDVVTKMIDGCAPLFLACKNGSAEVAEYLLGKCNAPIEQKGLFEVLEEGVSHSVTPLWCAAVSGRLAVVRVLLKYGADVDAVSDSGSTPVRSACYIVRPGLNTSHMDIIRALVEAGADIQLPNHFGGTCLINSVQSPDLVEYLINSGADVNAEDVQHKAALHYAVQEHRLDTTKVLVRHGADLFKKSKYGDDALQTACVKGALVIFNYLIEVASFPIERICDAFELMGASFLLETHDMSSSIFFWRKAMELRNVRSGERISKQEMGKHPVLEVEEFTSEEELEPLFFDQNQMKVQALLITERVLGSLHKDTIFRYMYAGAAHADNSEYKQCIALWNYALGLKIKKETLLSSDTSFTVRAVIQLFINILLREQVKDDLQFCDVVNTTKYINAGLEHSLTLLSICPQYKTQIDNFDLILQSWMHLVYLLLHLSKSYEERREIFQLVNHVKRIDPRAQNNDSILHMAVSSNSSVKSNSFLDDESIEIFPNQDVVKFLIECGYSLNLRNESRETPLHVATKKENYNQPVASLLLDSGAHICAQDSLGHSPLSILSSQPAKLNVMKYINLKCLAANVIQQSGLDMEVGGLPLHCLAFFREQMG